MKEAIAALRALEHQSYAYRYAQSVIGFDAETVAPAESAAGRAEAVEVLSRAQFDLLTAPSVDKLLDDAAAAAETEQEQAEVRELRRMLSRIRPIPAQEYAAFERLVQEAVAVWAKAKKASDFSLFAPYLEKLVEGRRRQAEQIAPGKDPYETMLDQYEPGLTIEKCDAFFSTVRAAIVPLLEAVQTRGSAIRTDFLDQDWPIDGQRVVSQKVMKLWGIDTDRCVLAESEHPFTDGFNTHDVRITTHYMPRDLLSNLYSVAHEAGHALYELHVDPALDYTVLAGGASMGLHESQSRLFENMVGRSKGCIRLLWPTVHTLFGSQLSGVTEEEFYRAANRAEPGLIRTEADELTYCLHIRADGGRPARRLERQVQGIPGPGCARRRPGRAAGHPLGLGQLRLLPQLRAGQRLRRPGHGRFGKDHRLRRHVRRRRPGPAAPGPHRPAVALRQPEGDRLAGGKPVRRTLRPKILR